MPKPGLRYASEHKSTIWGMCVAGSSRRAGTAERVLRSAIIKAASWTGWSWISGTLQSSEDRGPEFFKQVRAEFSGEAQGRPAQCSTDRAFAIHSPRIREKVISHIACITRVCGVEIPIPISRPERQIRRVHDAGHKFLFLRRDISRILIPQLSQGCFDCISGRHAGEPHSVSLCEAIPVRTVFFWTIKSGAPSSTEDSGGKTLWADCGTDDPFEALLSRYRLIGRIRCHRRGQTCLRIRDRVELEN